MSVTHSRILSLLSFYQEADIRMRDLPMHNPLLQVKAVGFQSGYLDQNEDLIGVMLTPWFMNLIIIPEDNRWSSEQLGEKIEFKLPSGRYEFIVNWYPETGGFASCSVFSLMHEFKSLQQAEAEASAVAEAVVEKRVDEDSDQSRNVQADNPEQSTTQQTLSRRGFLTAVFPKPETINRVTPDGT